MKKRRVVILGSTGSLGTSALKVARDIPERMEGGGLAAHGSYGAPGGHGRGGGGRAGVRRSSSRGAGRGGPRRRASKMRPRAQSNVRPMAWPRRWRRLPRGGSGTTVSTPSAAPAWCGRSVAASSRPPPVEMLPAAAEEVAAPEAEGEASAVSATSRGVACSTPLVSLWVSALGVVCEACGG